MKTITFSKDTSGFAQQLENEVEAYFIQNKKSKTGNGMLYTKTILLAIALIAVYIVALRYEQFWLFALLGVCIGAVGFDIMHDAAHGSFSNNKTLNAILTFIGADVMGGSSLFWKWKHNDLHHTYTNVEGVDSDIGKDPMFRLTPNHEWRKFHQYQHLYCWFLYMLITLNWFYRDDFIVYKSKKIGNNRFSITTREQMWFWIGKGIHISLFVILPFLVMGVNWNTVLCLLTMHASASILIAIIFQLAHVVEGVSFYPESGEGMDSWYIHEINTTADFATDSAFVNYFAGGLNFQVEHHLFPGISHIHYPAIHKIVVKICRQYEVVHHEFPSFWSAIVSHYRHLKQMGKNKN